MTNTKTVFLGLGNILNGDDGIGLYVANKLSKLGYTAFQCGTAPENFSGIIRKLHPNNLILIDAALMSLPIGSVRIIPEERINDTSIGTHTLPISYFIDFIRESAENTILIGIQPSNMDIGTEINNAVKIAGDNLIKTITNGKLNTIPNLNKNSK